MLIAIGCARGDIKLADGVTGQLHEFFHAYHPSGDLVDIAISEDGELVCSGSNLDVVLWSARNGSMVHWWRGHDGKDNCVCTMTQRLRCDPWLTNPGERPKEVDKRCRVIGHAVRAVTFGKGGRLASCSNDNTAKVWRTDTFELEHTLIGHLRDVWAVAFSPDGSVLATGSSDQSVLVWRMTDGMLLLRLSKGHLSDIRSLAYSPDGKQLVSGGADSTAVIWSLDPVAARCRVQLEDQDTNTLVWTPDGKAIVTGGSSCTVTVWDAHQTGELGRVLGGPWQCMPQHIWANLDGTSMAEPPAGEPGGLLYRIHDPKENSKRKGGEGLLQSFQGHDGKLSCICDPAMRRPACTSLPVSIATGEVVGHENRVQGVCLSQDGALLASGGDDRCVKVWDMHSGALIHSFSTRDLVHSLACGRDWWRLERRVAFASCTHERIGRDSVASMLEPNIVHLILLQV